MIDDITSLALNIITWAGMARSEYLAAVVNIKEGCLSEALTQKHEGDKLLEKAEKYHSDLMKEELSSIQLLLVHAKDQFMITKVLQKVFDEIYLIYGKMED